MPDVVPGIVNGTVACTGCGQVHDKATLLLGELQETVELLERDLRGKRSRIKTLQGDQADALTASPHFSKAMRVLEAWRDQCAPGAKELGGRRLELVIARAKKYSEEDLLACVAGYAKFPYVVDAKRSHMGTSQQWFADAELVFRGPKQVEAGIRLARREDVQIPMSLLATIPFERVQQANRKVLVEWLTGKMGRPLSTFTGDLIFFCPKCHDGDPLYRPLTVFDLDDRPSVLARCDRCRITSSALLTMLLADQQLQATPAQIAMI